MKIYGIIPARYASSRFPGKPLALINERPMIEHVYRRAAQALPEVYVATDDERIAQAVEKFSSKAILTGSHHQNGSSRCLEAYDHLPKGHDESDIIVNIQGDEPLLHPGDLHLLTGLFEDENTQMGTLAKPVVPGTRLAHGEGVFVTLSQSGYALYFSRSIIPALRDGKGKPWSEQHPYYQHIGLYAYRPAALRQFCQLPPSRLEQAEMLEQNRWLENDGRLKVALTHHASLPVDYPEDIAKIEAVLRGENK